MSTWKSEREYFIDLNYGNGGGETESAQLIGKYMVFEVEFLFVRGDITPKNATERILRIVRNAF